MARKKTSAVEDLLDLGAMLPWWGGVALAVISYLVLHGLTGFAAASVTRPGQVIGLMFGSLAIMGQYLIPPIFLLGAAISAWKRSKRTELISNVAQAKGANALDGMSWREFEMLVGEAFRLQGFDVVETGGGGADGGVDLVLRKGSEKFLVQCKQWKAYKVGVDIVRALYGVMAATRATGGFVVTSGTFTAEAKAFADGLNVTLMDGQRLFGMVQQARQARASKKGNVESIAEIQSTAHPSAQSCPVCASSMVKRTAKKGANAGSQFWGCAKYPGCRGTRAMV